MRNFLLTIFESDQTKKQKRKLQTWVPNAQQQSWIRRWYPNQLTKITRNPLMRNPQKPNQAATLSVKTKPIRAAVTMNFRRATQLQTTPLLLLKNKKIPKNLSKRTTSFYTRCEDQSQRACWSCRTKSEPESSKKFTVPTTWACLLGKKWNLIWLLFSWRSLKILSIEFFVHLYLIPIPLRTSCAFKTTIFMPQTIAASSDSCACVQSYGILWRPANASWNTSPPFTGTMEKTPWSSHLISISLITRNATDPKTNQDNPKRTRRAALAERRVSTRKEREAARERAASTPFLIC